MSDSAHEAHPDVELEALASDGDRLAFAELYKRHFDRVYDFVLRILRDEEEAADVTQDTFLKAMAALSPKEKKPAAFGTWLFTIARNTALDRLRRKRPSALPLEGPEDRDEATDPLAQVDSQSFDSPDETLEAKELAGLVWQAATALSPKEYSLLDLHLRQDLDPGEIAQVLGTSRNNAYVMLSRLKGSLEQSITALVMTWRGRRDCADLNALLTERPSSFFDAESRKTVLGHLDVCQDCQERRKTLVSPTAIFGALTAVPVPLALKQDGLAEAMAKWGTVAAGSAAKASGPLAQLGETIRSTFVGLKQAGMLTGWKGAALITAGTMTVAGGATGGALVLSEVTAGGGGSSPPATRAAQLPPSSTDQEAAILSEFRTPAAEDPLTPSPSVTPDPTDEPAPVATITPAPEPILTPTATVMPTPQPVAIENDAAEFQELAEAGLSTTVKVKYRGSSTVDGETEEMSATFIARPPDARLDLTLDASDPADLVAASIIEVGGESFLCSRSETAEGACLSWTFDPGLGLLIVDIIFGVREDLAQRGYVLVGTSEDRTIAGLGAKCFEIGDEAPAEEWQLEEVCLAREGGMLLYERMSRGGDESVIEATQASDDVTDADFELPYPVSLLPECCP